MGPSRLAIAAGGLAAAGLAALAWQAGRVAEVEDEAALAARLQALGYVEWVELGPGRAGRGVVRADPDRVAGGDNLYSSRGSAEARLIDRTGERIHSWSAGDPAARWNHVEPLADGDLLVIDRARAIVRIDRDSRERWRIPLAAHHDLALDPAGRIHALVARTDTLEWKGRKLPIVSEDIVVLSPEGEELRRIPLRDLLRKHVPEARLRELDAAARGLRYRWRRLLGRAAIRPTSDVFHANSIEILPRDVPTLGRRGDALVSFRELDLVAVIDLDPPRILWSFGPGVIESQHHASLLPNGNVLLFDNGRERGWSRVAEVDPAAGRIVWEWSGDPPRSLFSRLQGAAQQLENGNILVTESQRGRALEITRDGEIVWEYLHPEIDPARGARRSLYRLTRQLRGRSCIVK